MFPRIRTSFRFQIGEGAVLIFLRLGFLTAEMTFSKTWVSRGWDKISPSDLRFHVFLKRSFWK